MERGKLDQAHASRPSLRLPIAFILFLRTLSTPFSPAPCPVSNPSSAPLSRDAPIKPTRRRLKGDKLVTGPTRWATTRPQSGITRSTSDRFRYRPGLHLSLGTLAVLATGILDSSIFVTRRTLMRPDFVLVFSVVVKYQGDWAQGGAAASCRGY